MSIHNMAYQGLFGSEMVEKLGLPDESFSMFGLEYHGKMSFLKAGLYYADWITTVSPTYATEIQTLKYGCGLDGLLQTRKKTLTGIINGIDTKAWDPKTDPHLSHHYNTKTLLLKKRNTKNLRKKCKLSPSKSPLIGMITRLTEQKGLDFLLPIIPKIIKSGAQLVILGSGNKEFEKNLKDLALQHPKHLSINIGYNEKLAHQIEAGANIFLMPSKFEPCGLNQMYSMRYGTIPIVRRTGGLADTVVDVSLNNATGFTFENENSKELLASVQDALKKFEDKSFWQTLQNNGMNRDFSWQNSATQYVSLYQRLLTSQRV